VQSLFHFLDSFPIQTGWMRGVRCGSSMSRHQAGISISRSDKAGLFSANGMEQGSRSSGISCTAYNILAIQE